MSLPPGVHLREATVHDAESVHALYHAAYDAREDPHRPANASLKDSVEDVRGYIRDGTVLVAEDESGRLVGTIAIRRIANLRRLAVSPGEKQAGLGGALLDAAVEWAREEGFAFAELDTIASHPWLPEFYARKGFDHRALERMPDGSEWALMRRRLK